MPPAQPAAPGPYATPHSPPGGDQSAPTADDRMMAMLIHLLGILTTFLGPLIIWLIKRDTSRFVDYHGKEYLNFAISILIYSFAGGILGGLFAVVTAGIGGLLVIPAFIAFGIAVFVFQIIAAVKANSGQWYRYPLIIRFIR